MLYRSTKPGGDTYSVTSELEGNSYRVSGPRGVSYFVTLRSGGATVLPAGKKTSYDCLKTGTSPVPDHRSRSTLCPWRTLPRVFRRSRGGGRAERADALSHRDVFIKRLYFFLYRSRRPSPSAKSRSSSSWRAPWAMRCSLPRGTRPRGSF